MTLIRYSGCCVVKSQIPALYKLPLLLLLSPFYICRLNWMVWLWVLEPLIVGNHYRGKYSDFVFWEINLDFCSCTSSSSLPSSFWEIILFFSHCPHTSLFKLEPTLRMDMTSYRFATMRTRVWPCPFRPASLVYFPVDIKQRARFKPA